MTKIIGNPSKFNNEIIKKIKSTKINHYYIKNQKDFRDQILDEINIEDIVLDIGKSMREKHEKLKANKVETLDLNEYENPDFLYDLCDKIDDDLINKYNKIVCIAVLEHVYNPFSAIENLKSMLKKDGIIYGYVPYLYHYHAPEDLMFQDYFRFSKDALVYLFKDFSELELFPVRGRISSPLNILFGGRWKRYVEKSKINTFIDKLVSDKKNSEQCGGFNFIAKK